MKRLFSLILLLCALQGFTQTSYTADRIIARQSLYVRDWWVDSIARDTSFADKTRAIPSADAVYRMVQGRLAALQAALGSGTASLPAMAGNAGKVLTVKTDETGAEWSGAARYSFTNLRDGQHLQYDSLNNRWVNVEAPAGGASSYDSIAVDGTAEKVPFRFRRSDTALLVEDGGTVFAFKVNGAGTTETPPPAGLDADVEAWGTASGITDQTYLGHVSTFVTALKDAGIYSTHFDALYILAGGTEGKVKLNLLNPQDNDAAYRLTFVNGATFGATGVTTNGTNQYLNSHIVLGAMAKGTDDDLHIAYWQRTDTATTGTAWGVYENAAPATMYLYPYMNGNTYLATINHAQMNAAATTGRGLFLHELAGNGANTRKLYQDNTLVFDGDEGADGNLLPTTYALPFQASNNNTTINEYRASEVSLISVGRSFTSTQRTAFQNAVAQLITNLGL